VSCGTVFRVVQDQLRVSSGWVRCGRCGEVFNAIESLVDLEVDRPGEGALPSVHGARVMEDLARVAGSGDTAPSPSLEQRPESGPDREVAQVEPPPVRDLEEPPALTPSDDETSPSEVPEELEPIGRGSDGGATDQAPAEALTGATLASEPGSGPQLPPAFVRQANRAARWRHPAVRAALGTMIVAAALGLAWQVQHTHHDWVTARWPVLAPALDRVCRLTDCRLEPPRLIEALSVESSGLVREGDADSYRLSMVLRNREGMALRMPAVDLVMTDATGAVILRRVLNARTLGSPAEQIEPSAELSLAVGVRVSATPVVGYTIELFYP
jgi:predicted Zn finger-like uncharacterized protein